MSAPCKSAKKGESKRGWNWVLIAENGINISWSLFYKHKGSADIWMETFSSSPYTNITKSSLLWISLKIPPSPNMFPRRLRVRNWSSGKSKGGTEMSAYNILTSLSVLWSLLLQIVHSPLSAITAGNQNSYNFACGSRPRINFSPVPRPPPLTL